MPNIFLIIFICANFQLNLNWEPQNFECSFLSTVFGTRYKLLVSICVKSSSHFCTTSRFHLQFAKCQNFRKLLCSWSHHWELSVINKGKFNLCCCEINEKFPYRSFFLHNYWIYKITVTILLSCKVDTNKSSLANLYKRCMMQYTFQHIKNLNNACISHTIKIMLRFLDFFFYGPVVQP